METYCSVAEAWGDPDISYPDDTSDESPLTFQEMHNLPGYGQCTPSANSVIPQKKTAVQAPPPPPARPVAPFVQDLAFELDSDSQAHILNALLYIISGIYLIYTMDMFMRMGMYMK